MKLESLKVLHIKYVDINTNLYILTFTPILIFSWIRSSKSGRGGPGSQWKMLAECDVCAQHLSKSVSGHWATHPTLLSRPLKLRRMAEFLGALINHQGKASL